MNRNDFDTRYRWPISERGVFWLIAIGACLFFWIYIGSAIWMAFHG